MSWCRDARTWRFIGARYLPWLAVLSLGWEIAQLPLYTIVSEREWWYVVYAVAHCTVGDVVIGALSLVCALVLTRAGPVQSWRPTRVVVATAVVAVAYTVASEWMHVHLMRSWSYAPAMPLLDFGSIEIGLSPVVQWLVVVPSAIALAVSNRGRLFVRNQWRPNR